MSGGRARVAVLAVVLGVLAAPAQASFRPVGGNLNVDPGKGAWGSDLTAIGGTPFAVLHDDVNATGDEPVRVRKLAGAGWEFVGGEVAPKGFAHDPTITGVQGQPWVAFTEFNQPTGGHHLFASGLDGSTWSRSSALNASTANGAINPDLATVRVDFTQRLLLAWAEFTGVASESAIHVKWRRVSSSIAVWEQVGTALLVNPGWQANQPRIVADGGTPYIAWVEVQLTSSPASRVYVRRGNIGSTAGSSSWTALGGQLNQNETGASSPDVAVVAGEPWAAWVEKVGSVSRARVARYTAGGWEPRGASDLDVDPSRDVTRVSIANVAGAPYLVIDQKTDGLAIGNRVFVKRWDGAKWVTVGGSLNLDPAAGAVGQAIADVGGVPYVLFTHWGATAGAKSQLRASRLEAPTCQPASVDVPQNSLEATISLNCDEGTRLLKSNPTHGVLSALDATGGTVKYTPAGGYSGPDSFAFAATDGATETPPQTISINVVAPAGAGATGTTGTTGTPATRPTLSGLRRTHAVFRVGLTRTPLTGRTAVRPRRRPVPRGTTFSFRLNQAATVTMAIRRVRSGRRVGRRCLRPTRANRRRPRCLRLVTVATLRRTGRVGLNRIPLSGRIGRRALAPGAYRAVFSAQNAAGRSPGRTSGFTIVR